jgi:hypothetical protein
MNREEAIREARTIEAMKKGYTGLGGKFGTIAKVLGQPIVEQSGGMFQQSFLDDPFALEDDETMPTMDEDETTHEIGIYFDGMRYGINFSIMLKHYQREIACDHDGRRVYWEISGELEGYVPDPAWEKKVEEIYNIARERERLRRPTERQKLVEAVENKRKEILEEFRRKWGLT